MTKLSDRCNVKYIAKFSLQDAKNATMEFDLDALKTLVAVVDSGNLSSAANRMGRTSSALSRRITQLESRLDIQLFDRSAKQFRLTANGRLLLECARRVLDDVDATLNRMRDLDSSPQRELVVASFDSVAYNLLPQAIHAFSNQFPSTRVRLVELTSTDVFDAVARQTADVGLAIHGPHPRVLQYIRLLDEPFALACLESSPFAKREHVRWSELQGETLIGFYKATPNRIIIDRHLQAMGLDISWHYQVRHHASATALLRQGLGMLVLPVSMLANVGDEKTRIVQLVDPLIHRTVGAVVRKDRASSSVINAFVEEVKRAVDLYQAP